MIEIRVVFHEEDREYIQNEIEQNKIEQWLKEYCDTILYKTVTGFILICNEIPIIKKNCYTNSDIAILFKIGCRTERWDIMTHPKNIRIKF